MYRSKSNEYSKTGNRQLWPFSLRSRSERSLTVCLASNHETTFGARDTLITTGTDNISLFCFFPSSSSSSVFVFFLSSSPSSSSASFPFSSSLFSFILCSESFFHLFPFYFFLCFSLHFLSFFFFFELPRVH